MDNIKNIKYHQVKHKLTKLVEAIKNRTVAELVEAKMEQMITVPVEAIMRLLRNLVSTSSTNFQNKVAEPVEAKMEQMITVPVRSEERRVGKECRL